MTRKIISRRAERQRPNKIKRTLNLNEFYEKRNKILINRAVGGLGDVLMHRMMFEDIKLLMPDCEIHYACPVQYHDAVRDHPYVDKLLDPGQVDRRDYIVHYNTTTACGRTEMRLAPLSAPNRSDIWAEHCGFKLTRHNMHFRITEEEKEAARSVIDKHRDREGPVVLLCPVSAMETKNLLDHQLLGVVNGLHKRGCYVLGLHYYPIEVMEKNNIPTLGTKGETRLWMALIHEVDYVISVDTASFHCAGGMGKPLVGIFTFADGKKYGEHYEFFLVQKHREDDPSWTCGPCYNWSNCPKSQGSIKPCLTELTSNMILRAADKMFERWPRTTK